MNLLPLTTQSSQCPQICVSRDFGSLCFPSDFIVPQLEAVCPSGICINVWKHCVYCNGGGMQLGSSGWKLGALLNTGQHSGKSTPGKELSGPRYQRHTRGLRLLSEFI